MGYDPKNPMVGRITDLGPRYYGDFLPPVIKENKGKWLYHEILEPGVLMHVSETGAKVFTVRCGSPRLVTVNYIRDMCDIADKHCGGYLRFTTRNNVEFMVDAKEKVEPLESDHQELRQQVPDRRNRCLCHQHRAYPGLDPLPYSGYRCFRSG